MNIKVIVPAKYIAVLKLFAGKKDVRYYLNSIYLEVGLLESRLVACDGHRLGVFRLTSPQPDSATSEVIAAIIPIEMFKYVKAAGDVEITIRPPAGEFGIRQVSVECADGGCHSCCLGGDYIPYRRVLESTIRLNEDADRTAQFNPTHIADLGRAIKFLHGKKEIFPKIVHNGNHAATIDLGYPDFTGVLMPVKEDRDAQETPDWALMPEYLTSRES